MEEGYEEKEEYDEYSQYQFNLKDIKSINTTIGSLVGQSFIINGGKLSEDLVQLFTLYLSRQPQVPNTSPTKKKELTRLPIENSVDSLETFMNRYTKLSTNKIGIGCTELREKYNQTTGNNMSHVTFSRMMDEYTKGLDINKIQKATGKYYIGIEWNNTVTIPTIPWAKALSPGPANILNRNI